MLNIKILMICALAFGMDLQSKSLRDEICKYVTKHFNGILRVTGQDRLECRLAVAGNIYHSINIDRYPTVYICLKAVKQLHVHSP